MVLEEVPEPEVEEPELPEPEEPEPEPEEPEPLEPEPLEPEVVVPELLVVPDDEPEFAPLAETLPATITVPPSKFTPPALPPELDTEPLELILCAVAVTWLALVTLPEFRFTALALSTKLPFWPRFNEPLLVSEPEAFKVSVAVLLVFTALPALPFKPISASLATVRSP